MMSRCYPALVYVTRELVDKLRDIFTTSQHHIVAQAPPNIQAYTNIENILNTKDMELIMQNSKSDIGGLSSLTLTAIMLNVTISYKSNDENIN